MLCFSSSTTMLLTFRRRECINHELRGIGRPQDNIHTLACEFAGHRLHP